VRILFIGDICGKPGRKLVARRVPALRRELALDFVVANAENSAGGAGITPSTVQELLRCGIDVLTGGNHTWHRKEAYELLDREPCVLRPANFPPGVPGRGSTVVRRNTLCLAVLNLQGRVFMDPLEDPFRWGRAEAARLREITPHILVDFHAEATSEKMALAWYLDGLVTAVVGTHTHVQTADERILPGGTATITDVGMTGPAHGIIGMDREAILQRFLTHLPVRFEVAQGPVQFNAVVVEADETGRATAIRRIFEVYDAG
jgi:metallophosphoesterase (TIGR00282 family)